ncbi:MAG: DUF4349 domain-containing protein [Oceanicaulis sp.]
MRHLIVLGVVLGLSACDQPDQPPPSAPPPAVREAAADVLSVTASRRPELEQTASADAEGPMLAYAYALGVELPPAVLAETHAGHVSSCAEAGFSVCHITASSLEDPQGGRPSAFLQLRATPAWIAEFRGGLAEAMATAGGAVTEDATQVDDLTARIVDSAARVQARTTLRDRLQQLLETREGDLSDLLEVERELADVQEDLDAQASVLAALRQRVRTSELSIHYTPKRAAVEPYQFDPIAEAVSGIGDDFSRSVAHIISFLAWAVPWLVILGPAVFVLLRLFRRRRRPAPPQ